jgi:outer membrane biosynthesis protein TonB
MRAFHVRATTALALALSLAACGERKAESPPAPQAQPAPAPAAAPQVEVAPVPTVSPAAPSAPPVSAPAPAKPAPTAAPAPAPTPTPTVEPKPEPSPAPKAESAAPPAATHAKVGADKCKMCHRLQHQSWAASPHAAKGLDCEGCHGNGSDYWPASVMRDRAKAQAAGLVTPTVAACKRCHATDAARFEKVHAHKAR